MSSRRKLGRLEALMDEHMQPAMRALADHGVASITIAGEVTRGGARSYLSNMTTESARRMLLDALERLDVVEASQHQDAAKA